MSRIRPLDMATEAWMLVVLEAVPGREYVFAACALCSVIRVDNQAL